MNENLKHYIVIGPERMLHPGSWDPPEPPDYGRDVALIKNASNATEAKWAATKVWDKIDGVFSLPRENRMEGVHPLKGVKVERVEGPISSSGWAYFVDLNMKGNT